MTDAEFERHYCAHVVRVEMVQLQQMALLRTLIKHNGLREVLSEGPARGEEEAFADRIDWLRGGPTKQLGQVQRQLDDVRVVLKTATGKQKSDAEELEANALALLFNVQQKFACLRYHRPTLRRIHT